MPVTTGDIRVPVLTPHNLGDMFVPVHKEIEYARRVAARGNSDLLVQRAIRGVSHCGFTGSELATAFLELVGWVEFGVKPAGDDWLDPAAVADPDCRSSSRMSAANYQEQHLAALFSRLARRRQ